MASMLKRVAVIVVSLLMLLVVTALAQEPAQPDYGDGDTGSVDEYPTGEWQAAYWDNMDLAGAPLVRRREGTLEHDWGEGSPADGIDSDRFSARWTRRIEIAAGTYRFAATSDDGVRVWVDDELIIDSWDTHPAKMTRTGGSHAVGTQLIGMLRQPAMAAVSSGH